SSSPMLSTAICRLRPCTLLVSIKPAAVLADGLGGLHRLRVDDRGRGLGPAAGRDAALAAQLIMHHLGRAAFLPPVQHVIDGLERREVAPHGPPPDALFAPVADRAPGGTPSLTR